MQKVQIPKVMKDNVLMYFGNQGKEWLVDLPNILEQVCNEWNLTPTSPFSNLSINYVTPAKMSNGREVVIKLGVPSKEIGAEIAALSHFAGEGAVSLIDSDENRWLLILEKVSPGASLIENAESLEAIEVAAQVMRSLWKTPSPDRTFPLLEDWFLGLSKVRKKFDGSTGPFPVKLFEMAETLSQELFDSTGPAVLLHGDCHHDNIVSSERTGWLAIDPKGVVGDPAFELCPFLRNPSYLHKEYSISDLLPRRVRRFSEILGIDEQRICSWGVAEAILSASWDLGGDSEFVQNGILLAKTYAKMLSN